MHYTYKLRNGNVAILDYYGSGVCDDEDITKCTLDALEVSELYGPRQEGESLYKNVGRPAKKRLEADEHGRYFNWNGAKVYLADYQYYTLEELGKQQELFDSDVIQAILKHGIDKTGFLAHMPVASAVIPGSGIAMLGNKEVYVLCKIKENRYKVGDSYKIELVPDDDRMQEVIPGRAMYVSSITGFIKCGKMQIVDLEKARMNASDTEVRVTKVKSSIWYRLKRYIGNRLRVSV